MSDIELDPEEMKHVAWGRADSPRRPFCARCHAHLNEDDVPLMLWRQDGSCISLCDLCTQKIVRPRRGKPWR